MRKRIAFSQNFLKDKALVNKLLDESNINSTDTVVEIGAGEGIITEALINRAKNVVAFEIDRSLVDKLRQKFLGSEVLKIVVGDFIFSPLPSQEYKVFSNIPFNITAAVVKKLMQSDNPPDEAYLIVQEEAAKKFVGRPFDVKNSQSAVLTRPWFSVEVVHQFRRDDFFPRPSVDTVLMKIARLHEPLVEKHDKRAYEDFVTYSFNQFKPNITEGLTGLFGKQEINNLVQKLGIKASSKPSEIEFKHWVGLFDAFKKLETIKRNIVKGSYEKQTLLQGNLQKIHRSRTDKNWKSKGR